MLCLVVDVERCIGKIPCLLTSGVTTGKQSWNEYKLYTRRLRMLKKKRPEEYKRLVSEFLLVLGKIQKECNV